MTEKKPMSLRETQSENIVRQNCKYCKGYGVLRPLTSKDDKDLVACPLCGGSDFHKMIDTNHFDLKK